jgi:integration host factor subunit beta
MTKSELIAALSQKEDLTEKNATKIINLVFDKFAHALKNGGRVEIRRFGSFSVREYHAYEGRNPKTGEKVLVGSKRAPFFKVGEELKELVNKR